MACVYRAHAPRKIVGMAEDGTDLVHNASILS